MQKFSGIYMGKRRKQIGEAEAEMEGSGEDSEPQILAVFQTKVHLRSIITLSMMKSRKEK